MGILSALFDRRPTPSMVLSQHVEQVLVRRRRQRDELEAAYDAAQTTDGNRKHWTGADALDAVQANRAEVRRTLRMRSRYEVANNTYARAIVATLAHAMIGTGPRLQVIDTDGEAAKAIERDFSNWAEAVALPDLLWTMRHAKAQDGEAFALLTTDEDLSVEVKLSLRLVEADQVASPDTPEADKLVDGIELNAAGRPVRYAILKEHPGGDGTLDAKADLIDAARVVHWFRQERPGQVRGVPEITAALPLFAQLRRYTLAVIDAAELAADIAALLYTDAPADGEAQAIEPMDLLEVPRRALLTTPEGWKVAQLKAEQPTTTYGEFKREILNEIARAVLMPFNIAAGNSAGYNYSSGRLDHQAFFKAIRVDQTHAQRHVLERLLAAWWQEARALSGAIEYGALSQSQQPPAHQWFWDGQEHVDPAKEATAQATRLDSHVTTLAEEYARQGKDWETELRQRARETALMKELGLAATATAPQDEKDEKKSPDEEEEDDADSKD